MLNYEEVMDVLRIDAYQRKTQQWPLTAMSKLSRAPGDVRRAASSFKISKEMCSQHQSCYERSFDSESFLRNIKTKFPLAEEILKKYEGKLIVAGGALVRAINGMDGTFDLDFFFINCTKKEISDILRDLKDTVFKQKDPMYPVGCLRSLKTTTFIVETRAPEDRRVDPINENSSTFGTQYQFIHSRSYPNPGSVIGGFDITVAAIYFDGTQAYTTSLGAWSLKRMVNVVDPTRRSTTYEQRLRKYAGIGVILIFPFCSVKNVMTLSAQRDDALKRGRTCFFEIVKGLEVELNFSGICNIGRKEVKKELFMGDYGPVASGYASTNYFNAVWASRGKWESLVWTSETCEDVLDECEIEIEYPHYFSCHGFPTYSDLLVWLDEKKVEEIWEHRDNRQSFNALWDVEIKKIRKEVKKQVRKLENFVEENGVHYLGPSENPGRQGDVWTSSFNAVQEDVRKYYPPGSRITQLFISHETAFLLKCVMGTFYQRDVFKYILNKLAEQLYLDSIQKVKEKNKSPKRAIRKVRK
jgi:hypothetical protein